MTSYIQHGRKIVNEEQANPISATTMHLSNTPFTYGDRAKFFGAIVIIDGQSSEGPDKVNVRFVCDHLRRMPWAADIKYLEPITAAEESNGHTTVH